MLKTKRGPGTNESRKKVKMSEADERAEVPGGLDSHLEDPLPKKDLPKNNDSKNNSSEAPLNAQLNPISHKSEERGAFELFPSLPIEVRLKIWRLTFKKQHVNLDIERLRGPGSFASYTQGWGARSFGPVFPVAMRVNRESRQEARLCYSIMVPGSPRAVRATATRLPVCVNFSIDSCSFSLDLIGDDKHWSFYTTWLSKLDAGQKGNLKFVKELEINDCWWDPLITASFQSGIPPAFDLEWIYTVYVQALHIPLRFTGLATIYITFAGCIQDHMCAEALLSNAKDCRQIIQAFFDKQSKVFISGRVPEVKVRVWSKSQEGLCDGVYICSNRNGEEVVEKAET